VERDLLPRLSQLLPDSGFTKVELKDKQLFSTEDLSEEAFSSYALAYLTWDKPTHFLRSEHNENGWISNLLNKLRATLPESCG
jgi:hypothetical protein